MVSKHPKSSQMFMFYRVYQAVRQSLKSNPTKKQKLKQDTFVQFEKEEDFLNPQTELRIRKDKNGGKSGIEEKRRRSMSMMWGSWEMVEGVEGLGVVARRCSSLTEEEEVEVEEVREVYRDSMRSMQSVVDSQEKMVTTLIHRLQCVNHKSHNSFH